MELVRITKGIEELCYKIIGIRMIIHAVVGPGFPEEYQEYKRVLPTRKMLEFRQRNTNHSNHPK